jgi:hypothetical protein
MPVEVRFVATDSVQYGPPVVGPGTLERVGEDLCVRGFGGRSVLPTVIAVAVGLLGIVVAAVLLTVLGFEPGGRGMGKLAFVAGMVSGIAPAVWVHGFLRARLRGRAIALVVPPSGLEIVGRPASDRVRMRIFTHDARGEVDVVADDPAAKDFLASL